MSKPTPPNPPPKPEPPPHTTLMRILDGKVSVENGRLYIVYTMEIVGHENERFSVVLSGEGTSKTVQFVNALRCVEHMLVDAIGGGEVVPGVSFEPIDGPPTSRRVQ